jgi:hypothetical protein
MSPTLAQVTDYGRKTRYAVFVIIGFLIIGAVVWTWGSVTAFQNRDIHIGKDSLDNEIETRVVEVLMETEGVLSCSGVFIRESGEILTATHCLVPETSVCEFDPSIPGYPFMPGTDPWVEVMGVNDGSDKLAFPFEVVGYSSVTDVTIVRTIPITRADGTVITIHDQDAFDWDESNELSRGDTVQGLGYDIEFLKKLSHKGYVQAVAKDRGTSFAVSVDQVFVDIEIQPGASGMGMFNNEKKLVLAPLSYRWQYTGGSNDGFVPTSEARITASGTSSRVSRPLTDRMLNPNTPPNGAENRYLIPGLGIIPTQVVSATNIFIDWGNNYLPFLQMRGIIFAFLASQSYYDHLTTTVNECGFPPYTVTPPSMLGAPLDVVISGSPPDPFPDFPGGDPTVTGIMTILEAIEGHLDHNDWHYLGEDAGLTTVTNVILGNNKWVGDVVRVRIKSVNPALPDDGTTNWEGIYRVTLNAIDAFWDSLGVNALGSYVSYIHVNSSAPGVPELYLDPAMMLPTHVRGMRKTRNGKTMPDLRARNTVGGRLFSQPQNASKIYSLPTLAEHYASHAKTRAAIPALDRFAAAPTPIGRRRRQDESETKRQANRRGMILARHQPPKEMRHIVPNQGAKSHPHRRQVAHHPVAAKKGKKGTRHARN